MTVSLQITFLFTLNKRIFLYVTELSPHMTYSSYGLISDHPPPTLLPCYIIIFFSSSLSDTFLISVQQKHLY